MQIEHLDKNTPDGSQLNLEALYQIAPSCFSEALGDDGELHRVIDFNKLRLLLGDNAVDDAPEVYDFTWVGKRAALKEAAAPITKTLRPCPEESVNWDTTQNLYIEGDNLEVLKLLQNSYMGKVKMIYIDPPYNTGKDFVYRDNSAISIEQYEDESGIITDEGKRLIKNLPSYGRFHSRWCSMIYMRLLIARNYLAPDGIILISIGEHEIDSLKKIATEVFGEPNYIETYIWESTFRPDNSSKIMRRNGEYILCIAKDVKSIKCLIGETKDREGLPSLTKSSMKASVLSFPANTVKTLLKNGKYEAGIRDSYELLDDVVVKDGIIMNSFRLKGHVIWGQDNLERELSEGTEIIIKGENFVPYTKKAGDAVMSPAKLIPNNLVGDILSANAEMNRLFDEKVFSYPKPVSLIKYLVQYIDANDFIVMDFFSGSGTAAQAVMEANLQDKGTRKFILIQWPEDLDENLTTAEEKEKVVILNAIDLCNELNVQHKITEVAKERIRRAGKKILEEQQKKQMEEGLFAGASTPSTVSGADSLDIGFRVFKCEDSNYKEVALAPKDYDQSQLEAFVDNIKDDRTDLDLLFDCMLRWGVELSLPLATTKVDGCTIHNVNNGDLVACFDGKVTEAVIEAIAQCSPVRVVFRDSSFTEAAQKMNLFELFKQYCDWTDEEVRNNVRVI